jgi:hypothetical protein
MRHRRLQALARLNTSPVWRLGLLFPGLQVVFIF